MSRFELREAIGRIWLAGHNRPSLSPRQCAVVHVPVSRHAQRRQVQVQRHQSSGRPDLLIRRRLLVSSSGCAGRRSGANAVRCFSSSPFSLTKSQESKAEEASGQRHASTPSADEIQQDIKRPATGATPPQGSLGIVFTDIVKSTAIWEKDSAAMMQAMQVHDQMIRHLTEVNQGYEVKQNGDGFMIAFPTATAAVQFCLDVQEQLLDGNWPRAILKLPSGQETKDSEGHLLFRGLQLRMSAHWGTPVCNWNEVIQRMDYLGPMVNRAARFIEATEAGQIVVSEEFLSQLQAEMEMELQEDKEEEQGSSAAQSVDSASSSVLQMQQSESQSHLSDGCSSSASSNNNQNHETNNPENPIKSESVNNYNHGHGHGDDTDVGHVDLPALRSRRGQQKLTHQQFQVRLLGDHEFKGLETPQRLYFLVPRSLEGREEYWHQVTRVPGVKGNIRSG
ncbi:Adenylate cyclase [Exophiala dermatitidis]